jgi:hypothetical protein
MTLQALQFLMFDACDDGEGTGAWEAVVSVRGADLGAVMAEIGVVLQHAERDAPGPRGPLDEGGTWDADTQVRQDGDWTEVTLTLTGPWVWGEALTAGFSQHA